MTFCDVNVLSINAPQNPVKLQRLNVTKVVI